MGISDIIQNIFLTSPRIATTLFIVIVVVAIGLVIHFSIILTKILQEKRKIRLSLNGIEIESGVIQVKEENTSIEVAFLALRRKIHRIIFNNLQLLKIPDEGKKELIVDLLTIALETFLEKLEEIHKSEKKECSSYIKAINKAMREYEARARTANIPDFAIKKFRLWRIKYLQHVSIAIEDICSSNLYANEQDKELSILVVINYGIEMIISSAEQLDKEINGQLKGKTYKNFTIQG